MPETRAPQGVLPRLFFAILTAAVGVLIFNGASPKSAWQSQASDNGQIGMSVLGAGLVYLGIRTLVRAVVAGVGAGREGEPAAGWARGDRQIVAAKFEFWMVLCLVSALLGTFGVGRTDELAADGQWVVRPGPLTLALACLSLLSFCLVVRMLVRRYSAVGRRQAEWHRWLGMAGPTVSGIAAEWQVARETDGLSVALGRRVPAGPPQIGSLHGATSAYGLLTGHPIGLALSLSLSAARLAVNAGLKKMPIAESDVEEAMRASLLRAKARLVAMLEQLNLKQPSRLLRWTPRARRWARDVDRTTELLAAVDECLPPRAASLTVNQLGETYTSFSGVPNFQRAIEIADEIGDRVGVGRPVVAKQLAYESEERGDLEMHQLAVRLLDPDSVRAYQAGAKAVDIVYGARSYLRGGKAVGRHSGPA